MKKALLVLHQKRSVAGDIKIKLLKRGFSLDYCRPPLGDKLPFKINQYSLIVFFGGPMSANDNYEYIKEEINFMKIIINSNIPYLGICLGAQFLAKYLGSEIKHKREEFTGDWHSQVFLHYTNANGPFKDIEKDGRQYWGLENAI